MHFKKNEIIIKITSSSWKNECSAGSAFEKNTKDLNIKFVKTMGTKKIYTSSVPKKNPTSYFPLVNAETYLRIFDHIFITQKYS